MLLEALLGGVGRARVGAATKAGPMHPRDAGASDLWGGCDPVTSGEAITETTALNISACFCAINLISGSMGSLPLILYERTGQDGAKRRATDHPLYRLMHDAPNPEQSPITCISTQVGHMVSWGNSYAEIERDRRGRPAAVWPITPNRVHPARTRGDRRLVYDVTNYRGANSTLEAADVLHVPGLGFDGIRGYSVVGHARQTLGLSMAAEKFGGAFFGNGSTLSGFLKNPGELTEEAAKKLLRQFEARHQGAGKAFRLGLLELGTEFQSATMPLEDAQFLETRQFSVVEIARWFNVPPSKLKDMQHSKYATVEYHSIEYMTDTLLPWERRLCQELDRKLLTAEERERFYFAILFDAILRTDIKTRYEAHRIGIEAGFESRDEVRAMEDRNPIPDGKGAIFTTSAGNVPVGEKSDQPSAVSGQPEDGDLEFRRKAWLGFQADGTVADVAANLTDLRELTRQVGLPIQEDYEEPWLPVQTDSGETVTGEVLKDSEGDVVGGVAEESDQPSAVSFQPGEEAETERDQSIAHHVVSAVATAHQFALEAALTRMAGVAETALLRARKKLGARWAASSADWVRDFMPDFGDTLRAALLGPLDALAGSLKAVSGQLSAVSQECAEYDAGRWVETAVGMVGRRMALLAGEVSAPGELVERWDCAALARGLIESVLDSRKEAVSTRTDSRAGSPCHASLG